METDYKYAAQLRAEEIAEEEFGTDYYSLPSAIQTEVYGRALRNHWESVYDRADMLMDRMRERE